MMLMCSDNCGQRKFASDEILPDIQEQTAALRALLATTETHLATQLNTLLDLARKMNRPDFVDRIERIQRMTDSEERATALKRLQTTM